MGGVSAEVAAQLLEQAQAGGEAEWDKVRSARRLPVSNATQTSSNALAGTSRRLSLKPRSPSAEAPSAQPNSTLPTVAFLEAKVSTPHEVQDSDRELSQLSLPKPPVFSSVGEMSDVTTSASEHAAGNYRHSQCMKTAATSCVIA